MNTRYLPCLLLLVSGPTHAIPMYYLFEGRSMHLEGVLPAPWSDAFPAIDRASYLFLIDLDAQGFSDYYNAGYTTAYHDDAERDFFYSNLLSSPFDGYPALEGDEPGIQSFGVSEHHYGVRGAHMATSILGGSRWHEVYLSGPPLAVGQVFLGWESITTGSWTSGITGGASITSILTLTSITGGDPRLAVLPTEAVPEPAGFSLLGFGLVAMMGASALAKSRERAGSHSG